MSTERSEERRKGKEKEVLKVGLKLADAVKKCVASGISQNSPTLQKGEDRQWLKELVSV